MIISFSLLVNSSIYNLLIYGNVNFKIKFIKKNGITSTYQKLSCVSEFTLRSYISDLQSKKNGNYLHTEEMHQTEEMPINNVE